jgi:uncharacterized membrane protein
MLARARLGGTWAPVAALAAFYLAPPVFEVAWDYWHPIAFTALPVGFGAYFLFTGRPRLGVPLALLALVVQEEAAPALLGLGATMLLRRRARPGLLLVVAAVAWLAVVSLVIMPAFQLRETIPEGGNRAFGNFHDLRNDPRHAPELLVERGSDAARWLLLPTAVLPLLVPSALVASLPTALILILADDPTYLRSHHDAPILPLLGLATVEGLAVLRGGWRAVTRIPSAGGSWRLGVGTGALVGAALLAYLLDSRMPGGGNNFVKQLTGWDTL